MTRDEMMSLQPADGWGDGRDGFLFCRFSAVIDRLRRLRAEVVWEGDNLPADRPPTQYIDPQLELEYYRPDRVVGCGDLTVFEGGPERCLIMSITDDLAREILAVPPTDLLRRCADWFAALPPVTQNPAVELRVENHQPVPLVSLDSLPWDTGSVVYIDKPYVKERPDSMTSAQLPDAGPIGWVVFAGELLYAADTLEPIDLDRIDCQRTLARTLQPGERLHVVRTGRDLTRVH